MRAYVLNNLPIPMEVAAPKSLAMTQDHSQDVEMTDSHPEHSTGRVLADRIAPRETMSQIADVIERQIRGPVMGPPTDHAGPSGEAPSQAGPSRRLRHPDSPGEADLFSAPQDDDFATGSSTPSDYS